MIAGSVRIVDDGIYEAMVGGDLTIGAGCRVTFHGMIGGDLIVEPEAHITGRAMIGGRIRNAGGHVAMTGLTGRG